MWLFFSNLASPKKFFYFSQQLQPWLIAAFVVTFSYGLIAGLFFAPADYYQGEGFRIIYVHVPCAFLSLGIYLIISICAFLGLVFRLKIPFFIMNQSLTLGGGFTLLALITGSLWGKPMWGTWWLWDARLTSELILLFIYLAIILFQSAVSEKKYANRAIAMLILIGFIDIPIIHYSVYWWNTLHQGGTLRLFSPSSIDHNMLYPLLAMILAFFFYYLIVLLIRINFSLTADQHNHHWLGKL